MADKDPDGPSLELPSLGFGRRKRGPKGRPEVHRGGDETSGPVAVEEEPTRVEPVADPVMAHTEPEPVLAPEPVTPKERREFRLPSIGAMPAAIITGLLVGAATVGMTSASFRLCEVVQGTSSCGNPGFLLLVAIVIVAVYLGALLLRWWGLTDPGSTSFLAVGLLAVLALLFLVDVLFNWWMIIVIPAIAMATYALSHWVTTAFIEPADH